MKISKLHIDTFRHLENLDFDFTYPEDFHIEEKRGKPLDKICFIGQSATGKTGLLDLIYEQIICLLSLSLMNGNTPKSSIFSEYFPILNGKIEFLMDKKTFKRKGDKITYDHINYEFRRQSGYGATFIPFKYKKQKVAYFKANIISDKNIEVFTKNPIDLIEKHKDKLEKIEISFHAKYYGTLFNEEVDIETWLFLLTEILNYRKNFTQKISELIHIKDDSVDLSNLGSEIQKWQKENPNKIEEFAKKFNPLLEKLNLEVDLVNTEYSIPIKNKKTEEIIPIQNTSTGTKGLLLSFLPLFKLDTKDSIILIDEPERSLYPDMQMDLMDHYQNLAPNAQFIVATHSPFIAAAFEPEERFILYFDEEGKVAVSRGQSPLGDDPNDMLHNDFGINYINKYGQEKHQEYIDLKQKIYFEKDEKKKKIISEKLEKLGEEYNF